MRGFVSRLLIQLGVSLVGKLLMPVVRLLRRYTQRRKQTIFVEGLHERVQIISDQFAIPHVYAHNQDDLFFAQGYIHAQNRFCQMEVWRYIGAGRLAELVGVKGLETDKFVRTLGWNRNAQCSLAYYEKNEPHILRLLVVYSQGVNAYILSRKKHFSFDMLLLRLLKGHAKIEPWIPFNTLTWNMVMSDNLGENWRNELNRAELAKLFGENMVRAFFPEPSSMSRPTITKGFKPEQAETSLNLVSQNMLDWQQIKMSSTIGIPDDSVIFGDGPGVGSNAWVVSGCHTVTGSPLLANDTHLDQQIPSLWYEIGLHTAEYNCVGFSFAGMPGIVIGRNASIAWGITNARLDEQDLYIEKVHPYNPNQYEFRGQWHDMELLTEVIKVRGETDVSLQVRKTHHGPIIRDGLDGQHETLALQWTAAYSSQLVTAVILLNRAKDYASFRDALRYWDTPAQSFLYADASNIAYQLAGHVPIRKKNVGLFPVPGWDGEHEWQGWIPYERLPAVLNPEAGYIISANNAVTDSSYPYFLSRDWDYGDRAQRITDMLYEIIKQRKISMEDYVHIQLDTYSLLAQSYYPLFIELASIERVSQEPELTRAIALLKNWNCQLSSESVAATLFELFRFQLAHVILDNLLGADQVMKIVNLPFFYSLVLDQGTNWWQLAIEGSNKSREELLLEALRTTIHWCKREFGEDPSLWTWGSIHTLTFVNTPIGLSDNDIIKTLVNRGPFPTRGGGNSINAFGWNRRKPAQVTTIPAMRMIVDMSKMDASRMMNSSGQSGHPLDRHYDDMLTLWLEENYHERALTREAIIKHMRHNLLLEPAKDTKIYERLSHIPQKG